MRRSMQPDQEIVKTIKKLNELGDSGRFENLLETVSDEKQRFVLRQRHELKRSWTEIQRAASSFGMNYSDRQLYRIYKATVIELAPTVDILLPTLPHNSSEKEECSTERTISKKKPLRPYPDLYPRKQTCTCGLYDCFYYCRRTDTCDYALVEYEHRGCPASKDCTKYIKSDETERRRRGLGRIDFRYEVRKNMEPRFDVGFWESSTMNVFAWDNPGYKPLWEEK